MYNKKLVFLSSCLGMLLFGVTLITLGSVAPELARKFDLSKIASGTLFSIMPFGVLMGSFFFGPFCDKYGYKYLLVFSAFLIFIGFEGIAYATDFSILRISVFLFGLGGGAINGATSAVVADITEKDKYANLSLLGVFFGIGALGMPFVLALFESVVDYQVVVAAVGLLALLASVFYMLIAFPLPKHVNGSPIRRSFSLLKDHVLIFIAFFLFCQSSFEAIINNWTTSYLIAQVGVTPSKALYGLSLFVVGMTAMRLLTGSLFRDVKTQKLLMASFLFLLFGCFLLNTTNYISAVIGLVFIGAGLAGGFPIMLGMVAARYSDLSATAFSMVLAVALLGNMLVNYMMGIVAQKYGIHNLITVAFMEIVAMTILAVLIFKFQKTKSAI
jgi:FHS family glucose/mannose:H+ symporter-like MFS transporter